MTTTTPAVGAGTGDGQAVGSADAPLVLLSTGAAPSALQVRQLLRAARGRRMWWVAYTRDLRNEYGWQLRESRALDATTVATELAQERVEKTPVAPVAPDLPVAPTAPTGPPVPVEPSPKVTARAVAVTRAQSVARKSVKRVARPVKKAASVLPPSWRETLMRVGLGRLPGRGPVPGQRLADALVVGPLRGHTPQLLIGMDRASTAAAWYVTQQNTAVTAVNGPDPAVRYLDYADAATDGRTVHWRSVVGAGDEHNVLAALPPLDEARPRVVVLDDGVDTVAPGAAAAAVRAGWDVVVLDVGAEPAAAQPYLELDEHVVTVRPPTGAARAATTRAALDELQPDLVVGAGRPDELGPALTASRHLPERDRTHLLVAPANYAGQSAAWSRAVREHAGVQARNLAVGKPHARFAFPADYPLTSTEWRRPAVRARIAVEAVLPATHVLLEALRPVLATSCGTEDADGWDFALGRADVDSLRRSGRRVALLFHGSELRRPQRHMAEYRHSPFRLADYRAVTRRMTAATERVHGLLRDFDGPVFVSTLDLLDDLPSATWLPVVVGADGFRPAPPALERARPVVVHAPSNPFLKGTRFIEPVLRRLHSEGLVDYRRLDGVPSAFVGDFIRDADVLVDQIVLGNPGVLAAEALASGRLVVAHVPEHVRARFPLAPPIVEATPASFERVLRDIAADPASYRETAARGPGFAERLHSGALSARVLAEFLDS